MFFFRGLRALIQLVSLAILARILTPEHFGIFALANVVIALIQVLGSAGIGTFIIYYREKDRHEKYSAAFWLNSVITLLLVSLFLLAKRFVQDSLGNPTIWPYISVLLFLFIFRQIQIVPDALIEKKLKHPRLLFKNFLVDLVIKIFSIVLAYKGFGVWSLVIPNVVMGLPSAVLSFILARWWPGWDFHVKHWPSVFKYSGALMLTGFLNYFFIHADTWIIGRIFGTSTLGFFSLSNQMANIIGRNITVGVMSVGKSALGALKQSQSYFKEGFIRMTSLLSLCTFPLLSGLHMVSGEAILVFYGNQWAKAIPILKLLTIYTLVRSVTTLGGLVFQLRGRATFLMIYQILNVTTYLITLSILLKFDFFTMLYGLVVFKSLSGLLTMYLAFRELGEGLHAFFCCIKPALASSIAMVFSITILRALIGTINQPLFLGLQILTGGLVYTLTVFLFFPKTTNLIKILIQKVVKPTKAG